MPEAKVTVHAKRAGASAGAAEPPAAAGLAERHVVTDARGRAIELRKPAVLAQFRLIKILDAETAKNQTYVQTIFPLLFVTRIGEDHVGFPQSEREVEALITRLDDEGMIAVLDGVKDHWGAPRPEDRELVKN